MFCSNDDDIPTMFRRRFERNFISKSTRFVGKINITIHSALSEIFQIQRLSCVESSRASNMTSRDLGGLYNIAYPTPSSLTQASS